MQQSLFDVPTPDRKPVACHYCGGELSDMDQLLPKTCEQRHDCQRCCHECHGKALARLMRHYATHGQRSTRKHLGMKFPSGSTIPTPEDSAWAHAYLDELGW